MGIPILRTDKCAQKTSARLRGKLPALVLAPVLALGAAIPVHAQNQNEAPPGAIIISRDVPRRNALLPGEPGKPTFAQTAPDAVFAHTDPGDVVPLSDAEFAAVTADRPAGADNPGGAVNDALTLGLGLSGGAQSNSQISSSAIGNNMIGGLGSSIATGTNAVQGALPSIGSPLPGGGGQ